MCRPSRASTNCTHSLRRKIDYSTVPPFKKDRTWFTARNFFINLDALLKVYDRSPVEWVRQKSLKFAADWMLDHMKGSGGLGAIYPAMANSVMALHCLGYKHDDPLVVKAMREIEELEIHDTVMDNGNVGCHAPAALPFSDLGYRVAHQCLDRSGMPQDHPALQKPRPGCCRNKRPPWVTGSSPPLVQNRAAGISNSRTSCFRTSTTRRSS